MLFLPLHSCFIRDHGCSFHPRHGVSFEKEMFLLCVRTVLQEVYSSTSAALSCLSSTFCHAAPRFLVFPSFERAEFLSRGLSKINHKTKKLLQTCPAMSSFCRKYTFFKKVTNILSSSFLCLLLSGNFKRRFRVAQCLNNSTLKCLCMSRRS